RYFRGLLDRYRREPADNLLSALARAEAEGEVLSSDEIIATAILLLFAGHETTTNLIAAGMLTLDMHPEEKRRLAANPELANTAVEEFLRWEGPSKIQVRLATEDLEIRGREVKSGQRVFLVQAAAHRDPEQFADPDRVNVAREPNEHLGFGYGIHHCLGAPLARLEGRVVFGSLLARLPRLRVDGEPRWAATVVGRGLVRLPVSL
ncbi:MAG: cytochrome P450, partial [Candidatus Binatia bacterium]